MNVWLVTTGSSDVQLTSDEDWNDWWQEIKTSLYRMRFDPTRAIDDDDVPYRLPARVLGIAHDRLPDRVQPHLSFPLLQNFTQALKIKDIQIDQIIVLLSDQENIFPESERETKRCPYWQDTCQLYPILERYFHIDFPGAVVKPLTLKPESIEKGLDDWDAVLELVQKAIESLEFDTKLQTVYVSHQAGTPAISSAVQFASLAKFGDRVKFLVSNEQNTRSSKILESSSYLKGIRRKEAETLLNSHDYSGVKALIKSYLRDDDTQILLAAAIQWNFAKFNEFAEELQKLSDTELAAAARERSQYWWWTAYEELYLAVIRKEQGNIVEAFFHSFRAFEGIFSSWGKQYFDEHIEYIDGVPYLNPSALNDVRDYFSRRKCKDVSDLKKIKEKLEALGAKPPEENNIKSDERVKLEMQTLCKFFRSSRYKEYKDNCGELEIFWDTKNNKENNVSEKRNFIIHQVQGMSEPDLWKFWDVASPEKWEDRLLKFLNFIVKESCPEGFNTLENASLMAKVHEKLESAIAQV